MVSIGSYRVRAPRAVALVWLLGVAALSLAGEKKPVAVDLPSVHMNDSKTVRFRTPAGWQVATRPGQPELTEARGDGLIVRILHRDTELGLDSLHVECMLVRLAPESQTSLDVNYEYDFVGGEMAGRRVLDSAFVTHYDGPIDGSRDWRQRNVSVVGDGESVCIIGYSPAAAWKKSKVTRNLLNAVLGSVEFRPWR